MRFFGPAACVVSLLVACGSDDAGSGSSSSGGAPSTFSGEVTQGLATYYDEADGSGACGFDKTPNDLDVAAFDTADYAGSAACGSCLRVTGAKGSVTVRVVDLCPGCENHHLDLSPSAFAKIDDTVKGRVKITYQSVPCEVSGPIAYYFKDGSSKYYTAIQIRNHKLPIAKLEYKSGADWISIERKDYNYFVVQKGVGDQPDGLGLRVTAADGQILEDLVPGAIPSDKSVAGKAQFH